MYIQNKPSHFKQREIAAALQLWNRAAISLLDIRHCLISPKEALRDYRLPASAFLYASGKAAISLNDSPYPIERFGMFHGGKGALLSIEPKSDWLEYYMVLYKATEPPFHRREYAKTLELSNPFRQQYGFEPDNPVFLWELLRRMFEAWKQPTPLNLFYEKTSFYQLVYEIYKELESGKINVLQPDVVEMAMRYLDEHFDKAIAIQDVCTMLGVSYSHFHRNFKKRTGSGPQEYLIGVRIAQAKRLLKSRYASIPNIAEYCGFMDERNFRRSFLKNTGRTPNAYREELPAPTQDYALGNLVPFPYNEDCQVRFGELEGKGATFMLKQMRSKAVVAAALSLMLLLSACGTEAVGNSKDSASITEVSSQVTTTGDATPMEEGTRIVSTAMGDVEVPVNPQRIACYHWAGDLLSIGITPIASDLVELAPIKDLLKESKMWIARDLSTQEALMAMEPDLIMVSSQEEYDTYHKIAPTIVVPYETPLEERMSLWGEIFQKQDEAQAVLETFSDKVERYKEDLKEAGIYGKTIAISVFRNDNGTLFLCGDNFGYGAEIIYGMLDFKIPAIVQKELIDTGAQIEELSWEVVPEFLKDADYLQVTVYDDGVWAGLEDNEIWNSVPVVKQNKIIEYSPDYESASLLVLDKALDAYYEQLMELAKAN